MPFNGSRIRTALAIAAMLGISSVSVAGSAPGATAQEASSTYMDELLRQARDLLQDSGPNRDFAILILEELVGAGSDEAVFDLARVLADPQDDAYDFPRAEPLLEQAAAVGGANAVIALKLLAGGHRDAGQTHYQPSRAVSAYEAAAELGDTAAMIALADMLASGEGVETSDFEAATEWLDRAVSIGDDNAPLAAAALAALYRDGGDPEGAADAYRHAAEFGDTSAMVRLADLLVDEEDLSGARDLLEDAIAAGLKDPGEAWEKLADIDLKAGNPAGAVESLRNAASHDRASAMVRLAAMLISGEGVDQTDPAGAASLLERAVTIDGGHVTWAWNTFAQLRRDMSDPEGAAAAYRQSAELGDSAAMIMLAAMLSDGEGVAEPDFSAADDLLDRAIAIGDGNIGWAWYTRARIHRSNGDSALALAAGYAGADAGDTASMILLAQMLAAGEGVGAPDVDAAAELLDRAIATGGGNIAWAARTLASLYQNKEDSAEARRAFGLAAEHGDTASMIRLAALLSGEGEARDLGAATSLLQRAIGIGDSNQAWAWYTMGDVLRASDDAPGAVEAYAVGVDAGDPAAMIQLAAMLGRGEGVHVPDPDAAIDLLERATAIDGDHVAWGQRILAELHLSLATTDRRHLEGALKYYSALADAGDGSAHLAVAEIMAAERGGPEKWRDMIQHYREAARALGVETVTASMLRLDPTAMYASVQILLTEAGYQAGYVDGIRGRRTEAAIEGFCQDNRPPSGCMSSIVTRGLLGALIEASS